MGHKIGSFELEARIGEGSFGWLYRGKHTRLGFPVAIKQSKHHDQENLALFRDEARILSRLHHPSCPSLLDYIENEEVSQLIIMSWMGGKPLRAEMHPSGWADEHICWFLSRALLGLEYLHQVGIVHGDLKPENILIDTARHQVSFIDFGVATDKPSSKSRPKGGSALYLPPEFENSRPPIPESDYYSLGKVALELAGGDIVRNIPPVNMAPAVSRLLLDMLRYNPAQRPNDADALQSRIRSIRWELWQRYTTKEVIAYRGDK